MTITEIKLVKEVRIMNNPQPFGAKVKFAVLCGALVITSVVLIVLRGITPSILT